MHAFAKATGQAWKHRVGTGLLAAAALETIAFASLFQGNPAHLPEDVVLALFFPLGLLALAWYWLAVRCPACGRSPSWHHATHGPAADATARAEAGRACPACGYDPADGHGEGAETDD